MLVTAPDARLLLQKWGAWWRAQEHRELRWSPVSNGQRLIEMARLGISHEKRTGRAPETEINIPEHIDEVDRIVQSLPQASRAILGFWYIRAPKMKRGRLRDQAPIDYRRLIRSEIMVMEALDR